VILAKFAFVLYLAISWSQVNELQRSPTASNHQPPHVSGRFDTRYDCKNLLEERIIRIAMPSPTEPVEKSALFFSWQTGAPMLRCLSRNGNLLFRMDNWLSKILTHSLLQQDFSAEMKPEVRRSGVALAIYVILIFPSWWLFDLVFASEYAIPFLTLRLLGTLPALISLPILRGHRWGKTHPQIFIFSYMLIPEICIACMLPYTGSSLSVYLLGYSIIIYTIPFFLYSRVASLAFIAVSLVAPFVTFAINGSLDFRTCTVLGCHLGTTAALASLAVAVNYRYKFQVFMSRRELLSEKATTNKLMKQLQHRSNHDELTGLANLRKWREELGRYWETQSSFAVALIDIDFFKRVNDGFGHHLGDEVLIAIADVLKSLTHEQHFAARLGGDELAMLLRSSDDDAELLGYELLERVRELRFASEPDLRVSISIGIAFKTPYLDDSSELVKLADQRLYYAKEKKNRVVARDLIEVSDGAGTQAKKDSLNRAK